MVRKRQEAMTYIHQYKRAIDPYMVLLLPGSENEVKVADNGTSSIHCNGKRPDCIKVT